MPVTYAKFKAPVLVLVPEHTENAPNGSIFLDIRNSDALTTKTSGGDTSQVGPTTNTTSPNVKYKKNTSGVTIPAYKRIALNSADGSIRLSDSDDPPAMRDIGMSLDTILDQEYGRVLLNGPNVTDALLGQGFAPADVIFLGKTPGTMTNDVSIFNPSTDTIYRLGIADCPDSETSSEASDLIMVPELYSSP